MTMTVEQCRNQDFSFMETSIISKCFFLSKRSKTLNFDICKKKNKKIEFLKIYNFRSIHQNVLVKLRYFDRFIL